MMVELYEHQKRELEATDGLTHVAYYHDMGLGKTFTGAEKLYKLNTRVNLVVCQKSKVADWLEHFDTYYGGDYRVYDLTDDGELRRFVDEATAHKRYDVSQSPDVLGVINYDLAWRRKDLMQLENFTLLLDESSLIQNTAAKRTKFILKMEPRNVILLSGTPTGGKYERLWSQLHLLGWDISKTMYERQYVKWRYLDHMGNKSIKIVDGYKNVDRLKRKMAAHGCRFLKTDEVCDMPTQTFTKVGVDVTKEYRQFVKSKIVEIDGLEFVGDTTLTRMLYERQLCGAYNADKLKAFSDLLESTDDRIVVFYNFNDELARLQDIALELGKPHSVVNGRIKDLRAYETRGNSVVFVQYQAGAMGLNLQKANKIIYYTLPLSSELYEQSKKRIHRIGQQRPCFYYILQCRNSIEGKILKALEQRRDYTEKLFERG